MLTLEICYFQADIEEMCKKILSMKGVLGFIILNTDGT